MSSSGTRLARPALYRSSRTLTLPVATGPAPWISNCGRELYKPFHLFSRPGRQTLGGTIAGSGQHIDLKDSVMGHGKGNKHNAKKVYKKDWKGSKAWRLAQQAKNRKQGEPDSVT
jgi:hypothetical protein